MRAFFKILFLGLLITCISCDSNQEKKEITISIIHINDVYEIAGVNKGKEGGFARLAYLVDSIKKQNPNTIVVHAGDILSPSLIGNLRDSNNQKIKGKQMVEVMNAAPVDVVTFGNHEFDIKEQELISRLNESEFKYISANVFHQIDSSSAEPFYQNGKAVEKTFQKAFTKNGNSFNLGIVGVTLPFNQKDYVKYLDVENTIKQVLDTISSDKTILLTHLKREQDNEVAKKFQEVSLIMGGHDHYHFMDTVGGVYVAKADANMRTVWKHDLTYDFESKNLSVKSELIKLDETIKEKESVLAVVNKWKEFAEKKAMKQGFQLNKVIWEGDSIWECRETVIRANQTNFGAMVANAIQIESRANVVLLNSGSLRYDDQLSQVITEGDILKALPFGGNVSKTQIPGNELEQIIRIGLEVNSGTGGYLQIPNARIKNDEVMIDGKPINKTKMYIVCTSNFMASGKESNLGQLANYDWQPVISKAPNDIRNLVIYYLLSLNQ